MRVQFVDRTNGPDRLVCEAEVVFDESGPFWNIKLVGFCLWNGQDGEVYVTFPARAFGAGPERRYFDYLRAADGDASNVKNVKSWILAEYLRWRAQQPASGSRPVNGNGAVAEPVSSPVSVRPSRRARVQGGA